jgi:hypothetical protein
MGYLGYCLSKICCAKASLTRCKTLNHSQLNCLTATNVPINQHNLFDVGTDCETPIQLLQWQPQLSHN